MSTLCLQESFISSWVMRALCKEYTNCGDVVFVGELYLFLGYEDIVHKRLLFDDTCMAVHWKDKWTGYIKV